MSNTCYDNLLNAETYEQFTKEFRAINASREEQEKHDFYVRVVLELVVNPRKRRWLVLSDVPHEVILQALAEKTNSYDECESYRASNHLSHEMLLRVYTSGGHESLLRQYYELHPGSKPQIAQIYLDQGKPEDAEKYHAPTAVQSKINELLENYLTQRTSKKDARGQTQKYFYGNFFSWFQKSYAEKKSAVEALQEALKGRQVDLTPHLDTLRNGQLGHSLRAVIKSGQADVLFGEGQSVRTVRDFVLALNTKNNPQPQTHR